MLITDKKSLKKFSTQNRIWQGIPSIACTKKGRLFCTFYSGNMKETLGNFCPVIISDDEGKSWSEPICTAYLGENQRCYDPVLWIDPMNRLWFIWNEVPAFCVYASICEKPDEEKLNWSEPFFIGKDNMINKPTVLQTGEWLFPLAVWDYNVLCGFNNAIGTSHLNHDKEMLEHNKKFSGANVYRSLDCGKTFFFYGGCSHMLNRNYDEHMVYESSGVLVMLTRTNYGIGRSFSYDGGKTWTVGEDSGIKGPCSRFHIRRLHSGRLLLINHYEFSGRNNLTAMLSEDDGKSWQYKLLLDERNAVSYPDMSESEDGYLYIVYDRERGSFKSSFEEAKAEAREILLAKISEEDIMAGKLVSQDSFLKRTVSKLGIYTGDKDYYNSSSPDIDRLVEYKNAYEALCLIYDYYPLKCEKLRSIDLERMNAIESRIIKNEGDMKNSFKELIELLNLAEKDTEKNIDMPIIGLLLDHLQKDISHQTELSDIAAKFGISKYYMCHIFKRKTGMSIIKYRNEYRFMLAKKMLVNSKATISEICDECGFSDASYFSKKFKEKEGLSPSMYRSLYKN